VNKFIGILGGLGHQATLLAYDRLNQLYQAQYGIGHTCPIKLLSIDFYQINQLLPHNMSKAAQLLLPYLEEIDSYNVSGTIMINNTLHEAYDIVANDWHSQRPFGHIGQLMRADLLRLNPSRVLLVGTKYTMSSGYLNQFIPPQMEVVTPPISLQNELEEIRKTYLHHGEPDKSKNCFKQLQNLSCDAMIIACTEHSVAFASYKDERCIDTVDLQCQFGISILSHTGSE